MQEGFFFLKKHALATAAVGSSKNNSPFLILTLNIQEDSGRKKFPNPADSHIQRKVDSHRRDLKKTSFVDFIDVETSQQMPYIPRVGNRRMAATALRSESGRDRTRYLTFFYGPTVNMAGIQKAAWHSQMTW